MKAKIDLEKFICSLMKRFYKIHNIDPLTTKCWLDKVLEDQGLEYRDGEIVEIPQDSEDERIKKEILDIISISGNGNQFEEIKDWLEYKPQGKTALEAAKEEKVDNANKVEPKFKIGDWVMYCGKPYQITGLQYDTFTLTSCDGIYFFNNVKSTNEPSFHLWTIKDAKDGDTLCYKDEISLYKHDIKNCTKQETTFGGFVYHCCYDGKRFITDSLYSLTEQDKMDIHPATKEQRDTLMKAMTDAGYTFDFDKKKLKKIEQNLASSAKTCKNDTLLDLLNKMPSCITVDGIDYHFVMKKTIAYMAFYEGEGEGSGKVIFWMTAFSPIDLLNEMLEKLKKKGLL